MNMNWWICISTHIDEYVQVHTPAEYQNGCDCFVEHTWVDNLVGAINKSLKWKIKPQLLYYSIYIIHSTEYSVIH